MLSFVKPENLLVLHLLTLDPFTLSIKIIFTYNKMRRKSYAMPYLKKFS